jgi:NAD(P)H-dependent flavin oxidoreductase YrpB (nitropropane dioxygenase family)
MLVGAESRDAHHSEVVDSVLPPFNRSHDPASARVLRTPFEDQWTGRLDELREHAAEIGHTIVAEVLAGGGEGHVPFAGQGVGLVRDIRPAAEIVRETLAEAERILTALSPSSGRLEDRALSS